MMIDIVICHWLLLTMENKGVIQYGLEYMVGRSLGVSMHIMGYCAHGTWSD